MCFCGMYLLMTLTRGLEGMDEGGVNYRVRYRGCTPRSRWLSDWWWREFVLGPRKIVRRRFQGWMLERRRVLKGKTKVFYLGSSWCACYQRAIAIPYRATTVRTPRIVR